MLIILCLNEREGERKIGSLKIAETVNEWHWLLLSMKKGRASCTCRAMMMEFTRLWDSSKQSDYLCVTAALFQKDSRCLGILEQGNWNIKSEEQNVFRFGGRRSGVFMKRWTFSIYLQLLKYVVDPLSVQAITKSVFITLQWGWVASGRCF